MTEKNETILARGAFMAGAGVMLLGVAGIIYASSRLMQSWCFQRYAWDYAAKPEFSEPVEGISGATNTQPKYYILNEKQ